MAAEKRATSFGVEALVDCDTNLASNPYCEHGPTLLFERFYGKGDSKRFYACSACRDRKQCSFFQLEDEKITDGKKLVQKEIKLKLSESQEISPYLLSTNDIWCFSCSSGFPQNKSNNHEEHSTCILGSDDIKNPSKMLLPKENNKTNAQFFFGEETCSFLLDTIKILAYEKVICIGTPRLFEKLQEQSNINSLLLDIDKRFGQFYSSEKFLQYNMFNNFFFQMKTGENNFRKFLKDTPSGKILLIIDPPFGGLMNVLAKTIKNIWNIGGSESYDTAVIFPYFLESHVKESIPILQMSDYKVAYQNHLTYNNNNKRGSPVRLFTNIPLGKLKLPKDWYRFCKPCGKYVYKGNKHCKVCNACTSKDGRVYVHCKECKICVKPGRKHCSKCGRCEPESHKCSTEKNNLSCHICGELDHKRRECPMKKPLSLNNTPGQKRKRSENGTAEKSVKKSKVTNGNAKRNPKKKIRI